MSDSGAKADEGNPVSEPAVNPLSPEEELVASPSYLGNPANNISKEIASSTGSQQQQENVEEGPPPERAKWNSKWEFLMSCISVSVGLGNVWRFPVTAFENGGGAFLIPYMLVLFLVGRPIYFLELTMGQFASAGQIGVWKIVPGFKGVGYGSMIAACIVLTYYVYISSISVYYFFASFQKCLPWVYCNTWLPELECKLSPSKSDPCKTSLITKEKSNMSIPEMYFLREVIKEAPDINHGIGSPDWKLGLCLLFSWLLVCATLIRGIHSSGKVAWFTAIFPYVVMLIILIRGLTLKGAITGITYFVKPNWCMLLEPKVWFEAVGQCFFSLNTGFGSLVMFGSYNEFHHNVYRDAFIVSLLDTATSLLAGFTIFSVLGNLSVQLNLTDIKDVVRSGPGLAFISYPDAISKFSLLSVLFFLMLFTLGLGSAVSDCGAIITIFCDKFPRLVRWQVTSVVCLIGCALGLVYTTPGGQFIIELVDFYGGGFIIYLMSALEVIGVAWAYGVYNYIDDMEFMLKIRLGWYWKICWGILIPVALIFILIFSLSQQVKPKYGEQEFPPGALAFGYMLALSALAALPIAGFHAITKVPAATWSEKFRGAFKPDSQFGPKDPEIREEYIQFKMSRPSLTLRERFRLKML